VHVKNNTFQKSIYLRLTEDQWTSFYDAPALYTGPTAEGYDNFTLSLPLNGNIQFAVCFIPGNQMTAYWDNNNSIDYAIDTMKIIITCT
jgi:hypothetical protein